MKKDILVFPWRDWNTIKREGFRTREANILREIIEDSNVNKVLCINRPKIPQYLLPLVKVVRKDYIDKVQENLFNEKVVYKTLFSQLNRVNNKFYVLDLNYFLPNPKGNKLERNKFFKTILKREVENALNYIEMTSFDTVCWDVTRIDIANEFKNNLLIFDAIDNLLEHDQNKKDIKFLNNCYKLINNKSDIIFTVSKNLQDTIFKNHKRTRYIPNGIKLSIYKRKVDDRPIDLPKDKPIVGYIGLMQERIDIELLLYLVSKNKQLNFVFIGPVMSPGYFEKLKKYENVFFLGSKHHGDIINYLSFFNVAIIPHKLNAFTKSMNPLKLYEYIAANKEVVTTPVPPSEEYSGIVHIANNYKDFDRFVKLVIEKPFSTFSVEMLEKEIVKHDWSSRYYEMKRFINLVEQGEKYMLLENSVCVVTVTYGNRWFLLSEVLKSLVIKKYIKKIIVIDNNSEKDIETLCSNLDNRIEVIKFDSNLGSAKGFKVGLSEAYKSECDFIWMLDDDNRPQSNSLEILLEEYKKQSTSRRKIPFSLLSLRTDRTEFLLSLKRGASKGIFPHQNSFLGIHILELPKKIFRKILSRDYRRTRNNQKEIVSVPMAPYGGMFFSKELLAEIGLPNDSFYLYSDDYEFSHRIPKKGGEILLVGKSKIDDIDKSWFIKTNKPYLVSLFETEDDFRVFYGVRNRIYFETKDLVTNNLIYSVNKIFTMTFLYLLSILYKKKKRYKLLKRAITDGQNKQLGKMNFE